MTKKFKGIKTKSILKNTCRNQCGLKYNFLIDLAILHY